MAHGKSQPKTASVGQIQSSNRHEGAIMKSKDEKHQVFMWRVATVSRLGKSVLAGVCCGPGDGVIFSPEGI